MKRLLSSLALCMALTMQPAQADFIGDCTKILNGAQESFKDLFPTDPDNQFFEHWCFRAYPGLTGLVYLGFTLGNSDFPPGVHGLNGIFGDTPSFIATRDEAFALLGLDSGGGGGGNEKDFCDNSNSAITGIDTIQDGNNVLVTTHGECVDLPTNSGLCTVEADTDENGDLEQTNIHMLTVTDLVRYEVTGFDLPSIPGFPDPLSSIAESFETTTCLVHAPRGFTDIVTEIDVCFNVSGLVGSIPGISDDVTIRLEAKSTSTVVDDCANTGADSIINLVTGAAE